MKCGAYCVYYYKFTCFGLILKHRELLRQTITNVQTMARQLK